MFRHLRTVAFALAASSFILAAPHPASGQALSWIADLSGWSGWGALEHANGDKVAVGRFNTLHVVWEEGSLVKYSTSIDGYTWTTPELVAPGLPAALPAIASDTDGTLVVAFVANPDVDGLGTIQYARKAWGATSWTVSPLVNSGTQPDIDARAGRTHVVWTTFDRVQYTTFATQTPPPAMNFGEEIEVSACPNTGFIRPSVALPRKGCRLTPTVAYLRTSDETANPNPSCASLVTEIGPRVCTRNDSTATWSLDYTDLQTQTNPALGVEGFSLSLNAEYRTGNTFLTWSDTSNGNTRTRLARGRNGTWNATTLDTDERHAHVAAKRNSLSGEFRIAWVSKNGAGPYADWDASFRTGSWGSGAAPTWTQPAQVITYAAGGGSAIGRPQATFWGRCAAGDYTTMEVLAEVEGVCSTTRLMNHIEPNQSCPPSAPIGLIDPCQKVYVTYTSSGADATRVDTSALGEPTETGDRSATITLKSEDGDYGTVTFEWDRGELVESSDGGFVISDRKATVRLHADGVRARLKRLPDNLIYDEIKPRELCGDRSPRE
ncbi:MAG: hypothetical protein AAGM22_28980 [Acidobacteriota bacterium]